MASLCLFICHLFVILSVRSLVCLSVYVVLYLPYVSACLHISVRVFPSFSFPSLSLLWFNKDRTYYIDKIGMDNLEHFGTSALLLL